MATPPVSPPHPLPPPPVDASTSPSTLKRTRKATRLQSLATRPPGVERPVVNVDLSTGKADGPHKKKLRIYLGIVARDKVDVTYDTWKEVLAAQKDLIWEDIQAEFEIPEASNSRTKKKILQTVGECWRQFKSDLTRKWALAADKDGVDDIVCEKYGISNEKWTQFCQTRKDSLWEDSLDEQTSQGLFVPHGRQDVLIAAIGRPEHPDRVRAIGADFTIKQYFGSTPRTSRSSSSMPPEDLQQLTQQIKDQLKESITEKVTRQLMASFSQMQSQFQSQMQSQGLALPPEPEVGPSGARVSTKESCVAPSGNDPGTGDSDKCGLYIEENPSCLVALGRLYEGFTTVHNIPLFHGQVKVGVEEVKDAEAFVPVPTDEVTLVGQTLNTFLAWPTHLVKFVSPAKPPKSLDDVVDDPLYLMALTIPQLFLKPLQVMWDATIFGVFNENFPLYIKHEDLSEITHGGQCLNISVIQFWILGHWQMVVILPKENLVVWFCSLHNRPDNYLKGIINSALKGLDDTPQPKSKVAARWIVVKYFNEVRPLEVERFKALHIQWAQYYLKVRNQT
ncbi:hypothetical protein GmHk_04G010517 [Glycine max]|nr:hypothetical protein GmHk_04G010517 [Glycine max]